MELTEGIRVMTVDGQEMGKISRIVINPVTRQITHIVTKKGFFLADEKVIAIEAVREAQDDAVVLALRGDECRGLPAYEETRYGSALESEAIRAAGPVSGGTPYYSFSLPFGINIAMYLPEGLTGEGSQTRRLIPRNTIPLKEGANVISADGDPVGRVERIITDGETRATTGFLIRRGGRERKLIPVKWVRYLRENEVFLGVRETQVDRLPVYRSATGRRHS